MKRMGIARAAWSLSFSLDASMPVVQAISADHIILSRILFREHASWLGADLSFQGFENELATLPGLYDPPRGRRLLSIENDEAAGCVALRPMDSTMCEMKRLFVRPSFRGRGIGRFLVQRLIEEARAVIILFVGAKFDMIFGFNRMTSGFTVLLFLFVLAPLLTMSWVIIEIMRSVMFSEHQNRAAAFLMPLTAVFFFIEAIVIDFYIASHARM